MAYRSLWAFAAFSVTSVGVVVACESTGPDGNLPTDVGSGQPDGGVGNGGYDASLNDSGKPSDDGGVPDAAPAIRDRFRHQWAVTADEPLTSSYVVDEAKGVVTDKVTGLQWTRGLLNQGDTSFDGGGGDGTVSTQSQADARALCSNATVGGLTGWRLPTMVELLTIVSFTSEDWNNDSAFLDTSYGAAYFVDSNTADYFLVYDNHYHPWRFVEGAGYASIRCVRSPYAVTAAPEDPPAGRYIVKSGSVVDTVTKLEWEVATSPGVIDYGAATSYCENLAANDAGVPPGGEAWRIPTLKELATIWSEGAGGLEPTLFGPVSANGYVWSSTTYWGTQSIPFSGKNIRFDWQPGGKKIFTWDASSSFSFTKCVRSVP